MKPELKTTLEYGTPGDSKNEYSRPSRILGCAWICLMIFVVIVVSVIVVAAGSYALPPGYKLWQ